MYKIEKVHIEYVDNKITLLAVLWQSNERGWVRATYCTTKPCAGYAFLMSDVLLTPEIIQKVAAQGMELPDRLQKKYFPGRFQWEE